MPLFVKALAKKVGGELLGTEDGAILVPNQHYLPSIRDILLHFVHLQGSEDPPHKADMLRLFL